jgi:hypothetical protein
MSTFLRRCSAGSGRRGRGYYRNKDLDWKGQLLMILDSTIDAAIADQKKDGEMEQDVEKPNPLLDDYLNDKRDDGRDDYFNDI